MQRLHSLQEVVSIDTRMCVRSSGVLTGPTRVREKSGRTVLALQECHRGCKVRAYPLGVLWPRVDDRVDCGGTLMMQGSHLARFLHVAVEVFDLVLRTFAHVSTLPPIRPASA